MKALSEKLEDLVFKGGTSLTKCYQLLDRFLDYNMSLDSSTIEDILTPTREVIAPEEIVVRIRQETGEWANKIVDQLHTKVQDFRFAPTVFLGGGSKLLAPFLEATGMFGVVEYMEYHTSILLQQQLFVKRKK